MSQPGWFPDPAGQPGQFRYWDGQRWAEGTSPTPGDPAGMGAVGIRPAGQGQPNRAPVVVAIVVVVALAVVVALVVRALRPNDTNVAEDGNTSTPTVSAWDETSTPTPTSAPPTEPTPTGATQVSCPDNSNSRGPGLRDGRYYGGGLSYAAIPGWENRNGWGLDWAQDRAGQRQNVTGNWVALVVVGEVDKASFLNPQQASRGLISCLASSAYYSTITKRVDKSSAAVTVDGRPGWRAVSEIWVSDRGSVLGDVIQVIVVDTGREGMLSVFVSEAPIGDSRRNGQTDAAAASIRVES